MSPYFTNLWQVTQIATSILILYIAFNSSANIQSSLMSNDGFDQLGFYLLAILYFFMGVGSLTSTAINNKYGTRACLIIGGCGNVIWILSSILASKYNDYRL